MLTRTTPLRRAALALATGLLVGGFAVAADFGAGLEAYRRGDYPLARAQWQPLAERGDPKAQFNLGLLYANGMGVARDLQTARRWFEAAAENGSAQAQYNLALMLQTGNGVERDFAVARRWYESAARQGLAAAQNNLGLMYLNGEGMPRDQARAVRWLNRAAAAGSAQARVNRQRVAGQLPEVTVAASRVNLRAGPSRQARAIDQVREDETARLLDRRGGWSRLWFVEREQIGWIADTLVRMDGDPLDEPGEVAQTERDTRDVVEPPEAPADAEPALVQTVGRSEGPEAVDPPASLLSRAEPEEPRLEAPAMGPHTVASASARLRAEPKGKASVIERLGYGTRVNVREARGGWRRIELIDGAAEGWVAAFVLAAEPGAGPEPGVGGG